MKYNFTVKRWPSTTSVEPKLFLNGKPTTLTEAVECLYEMLAEIKQKNSFEAIAESLDIKVVDATPALDSQMDTQPRHVYIAGEFIHSDNYCKCVEGRE